jgi:hypothetical protein
MKTLTIVFMIHTLKELGSLREKVKEAEVRKRGVAGAEEFFGEVEQYWHEVARTVHETYLGVPDGAKNLCIFIDALPNVHDDIVQKIVADLTDQKIPAYLVSHTLQEAGAKVYGTEDAKLLLEEYAIWTKAAQGEKADPWALEDLLLKRDHAIAKRIDEVIPEGGLGLLFIGRAHNVEKELEKLPTAFRLVYL